MKVCSLEYFTWLFRNYVILFQSQHTGGDSDMRRSKDVIALWTFANVYAVSSDVGVRIVES